MIIWFCRRFWLEDSIMLLEILVGRLYGFVGDSGYKILWFCRRFWLEDSMVL